MDFEFKSPASTPRVTRSPFVPAGQAFVMSGDSFEDGKTRLIVSASMPPDDVAMITETLERSERISAQLDSMITFFGQMRDRAQRSASKVLADVEASYAATHARLADDPEYQRLQDAATLEERETPTQHFHRNHLAIYVELNTPLIPRPPDG